MMQNTNTQVDFTDEMAQLKWRIEVLKQYSRTSNRLPNPQTSTITGKKEEKASGSMTFEEMYNQQKKKFTTLKQRRHSKMNDGNYFEMVGKMQLRRESRKVGGRGKV